MEDTWLNPDFATGQIITLVFIILASLVILGAFFGVLIYVLLGILGRISTLRRANPKQLETEDTA